ncbi:Transcription factor BTF3 4 [Balamuthia mandrillaris]
MQAAKLARLQANVRIGGKGTPRRKHKAKPRAGATNDRRLQSELGRMGVNELPGIEAVDMFHEDGSVLHFTNPKVQTSGGANMLVVTGRSEKLQFPAGAEGLASQVLQAASAAAAAADKGGDDDVPELVENFDQSS